MSLKGAGGKAQAAANLAAIALDCALRFPDRSALIVPREWSQDGVSREEVVTFAQLRERVLRLADGLSRAGLREGDRVLALFPVGVDFYALLLAIVASGMVAVSLDGSMERKRILSALKAAQARAVVSVDVLLKHRYLLPALWGTKRFSYDRKRVGVRPFDALVGEPAEREVASPPADSSAFVTFTSGSTKVKGVDRTHGLLLAQHEVLEKQAPAREGDVDMPCFPALAFYNLCIGATTVLPAVDLRAPGTVEPGAVLSQIRKWKVTGIDAAPAFHHKLASAASGIRLRYIATGGAPASRGLCRRLQQTWSPQDGRVFYGSTEAEPMAHATLDEVASTEGEGLLVGKPIPEIDLELHEGEVRVRGAHVNKRYLNDDESNRRFKIPDGQGGIWHRTGDVAHRDDQGRLWLLGRLGDSCEVGGRTVWPLPIEIAVTDVTGVRRAGFVDGKLAVELERDDALQAVLALLRSISMEGISVHPVAKIPVDARHNSKVDRAALREVLR
jgi:acyl-CoA synthetase (AMP-forming)/AMP-acid ligase II